MSKKWVAVCPVCEQPIDTVANPNAALDIATGEWYHGPCSRYMNVVLGLKYGASSGRFDSSKPNLSNTPQGEWDENATAIRVGFGDRKSATKHEDSTLCRLCLVWSNNKGPQVHSCTCPMFGVGLNKPREKK